MKKMNDLKEDMFEEIVNPEKKTEITPYEDRSPIPSHAQILIRMDDIIDMLVHQKSNKEIKKVIAEKYGISEETVRCDIPKATKIMIERMPDPVEIISKNIETYRRIAESAENDNDRRTAVISLQAQEKLMRLHQPEIQNQNNTLNINIESVDFQTLRELLNNAK